MKQKLMIIGGLLLPLCVSGQDPSSVRLVNAGKMMVAPNGGTTLYVPWSVRMITNSQILQQGRTAIDGSFYQDAATNAFKVDAGGWGTSSGVIAFTGDNASTRKRYISSSDVPSFDRSATYIAFPQVNIETGDEIRVPGRIGMDATKINRPGGKTGILYLQSDVEGSGASARAFDASLRITGSGTSESLVPAAAVVIERDMTLYRSGELLFGFASPFKTQKSGYFAGNWVRTIAANAGDEWHAQYPYANLAAEDGYIAEFQYVKKAYEELIPSQAYLIRPHIPGYNYSGLDLVNTNPEGENHNLSKFIFNGNVYNTYLYNEQVFAEDNLINRTIPSRAANGKTVNWVIGNSYTSALDVEKIKGEMAATGLTLYSQIYVFLPGSTGYQPYSTSNSANSYPQLIDLEDIPSQSILMVRLPGTYPQNGTFKISKGMQTHGKRSHNLRSADNGYNNEILFRISPEDNPNVYDLSVVGLRSSTAGSQAKMLMDGKETFQMYTLSDQREALSINVVKDDTKSVRLCVRPSSLSGGRYVLEISRQESLLTPGVWLEDLKTGNKVNLKTGSDYVFEMEPNDLPERFVVHFTAMTQTGLDDFETANLQAWYAQGMLNVQGLREEHVGSRLTVFNLQGRHIYQGRINSIGSEQFNVSGLTQGIYLVQISGKQNITLKFRR